MSFKTKCFSVLNTGNMLKCLRKDIVLQGVFVCQAPVIDRTLHRHQLTINHTLNTSTSLTLKTSRIK